MGISKEKMENPVDSAEINELKEKIKARGSKLQEKLVNFNKKIDSGGSGTSSKINDGRQRNLVADSRNDLKQQQARPHKLSSTSSVANTSGESDRKSNSAVNTKTNAKQQQELANQDEEKLLRKMHKLRMKMDTLYTSLAATKKKNANNSGTVSTVNGSVNSSLSRSSSGQSSVINPQINSNDTKNSNEDVPVEQRKKRRRGKRAGRSRTNSERSSISQPLSTNQNENSMPVTENNRKRNRGKRSDMKSKQTQANAEHIPIYAREVDTLNINAESLLILDLLALPIQEHTDYLINMAKVRKILIKKDNDFVINPEIVRLKNILMLGNQCRYFNESEARRLENIANGTKLKQPRHRLISESQKNKFFEDYINAIVHDELPEEHKKEFFFPPQTNRTVNYFRRPEFEDEVENFAQKCVEANLGIIVESEIRINAKNNDQSFIKNVYGERDAFLCCSLVRKYALHGDIVRAFVRNNNMVQEKEEETKTKSEETTTEVISNNDFENLDTSCEDKEETIPVSEKNAKAFVIKIVKEVHNRKCVGTFLSHRKDSEACMFVPRDMKMPGIKIYRNNWPASFKKGDMTKIGDMLYVAQVIQWKNDLCIGKILQPVGKCGELESENKAILLQNDLHMDPYEDKFNEMYQGPLVIDENVMKNREDIRSECVFTIDPLTARDLDDAMSCKELSNGNYEIGVHISDVSYFLEEESELDKIVKMRTTSVYMVNEVFHMLPQPMCFKCSLLPSEDKLALSVFWIMNREGEILSTRFSRTLLNSCTQFAYEHAQKIIDCPEREFTESDFPTIHNGFSYKDIVKKVICLNSIAENLRKKRFDNGALKINKPKLYFDLDPEKGNPTNFSLQILQTANFLIEEFMLLANQSVAEFIYKRFPKISILRKHEPPLKNVLQKVKEKLEKYDMQLDINNSKSIYESFNEIIEKSSNPEALEACLSQIVSKPMARAKYFCSTESLKKEDIWHFALSIPIYTHFTSPIRRYPDVLVHRVLIAALDYTDPPNRSSDELNMIAAICNEKKYTSKLASEDSMNLYFLHYIKTKRSVIMRAAILEIFSNSMEVVLIDSGHTLRVHYPSGSNKNGTKISVNDKSKTRTIIISTTNQSKEFKTFDEIEVEVFVEKLKLKAKLPNKRSTETNEDVTENKTASIVNEEAANENVVISDEVLTATTADDDEIDFDVNKIPTSIFENGQKIEEQQNLVKQDDSCASLGSDDSNTAKTASSNIILGSSDN